MNNSPLGPHIKQVVTGHGWAKNLSNVDPGLINPSNLWMNRHFKGYTPNLSTRGWLIGVLIQINPQSQSDMGHLLPSKNHSSHFPKNLAPALWHLEGQFALEGTPCPDFCGSEKSPVKALALFSHSHVTQNGDTPPLRSNIPVFTSQPIDRHVRLGSPAATSGSHRSSCRP